MQFEVDPVLNADFDFRQVVRRRIFDSRCMSKDEVELESLVAVILQLGWYSLRLEESCEGLPIGHDYRQFLHTPQDMCLFVKRKVHGQVLFRVHRE